MTFKIFDDVIIYEPTLKAEQFNDCKVINNFEEFSKNQM